RAHNDARGLSRIAPAERGPACRASPRSIQSDAGRGVEDTHAVRSSAEENGCAWIRSHVWSGPDLEEDVAEHHVHDDLAAKRLRKEHLGRLRPGGGHTLEIDRLGAPPDFESLSTRAP